VIIFSNLFAVIDAQNRWRFIDSGSTATTFAGDVAIFVHEPSVDVHVSGSLVRGGSWEPHLVQLMFSLLNQDPNLQFIDLGANLGVLLAFKKLDGPTHIDVSFPHLVMSLLYI
jgi:hypothetical protein